MLFLGIFVDASPFSLFRFFCHIQTLPHYKNPTNPHQIVTTHLISSQHGKKHPRHWNSFTNINLQALCVLIPHFCCCCYLNLCSKHQKIFRFISHMEFIVISFHFWMFFRFLSTTHYTSKCPIYLVCCEVDW